MRLAADVVHEVPMSRFSHLLFNEAGLSARDNQIIFLSF